MDGKHAQVEPVSSRREGKIKSLKRLFNSLEISRYDPSCFGYEIIFWFTGY